MTKEKKLNPHKYNKQINKEVTTNIPPIDQTNIDKVLKDNNSIDKLFFYEGKYNSKTNNDTES